MIYIHFKHDIKKSFTYCNKINCVFANAWHQCRKVDTRNLTYIKFFLKKYICMVDKNSVG